MKSAATLALVGAAASSIAYTVDPPSDAPDDTIQDCTYWVIANDDSTCKGISDAYYVDLDDFENVFNPSVGSDCDLITGDSYCVEENYGIGPGDGGNSTSTTTTMSSGPTSTTVTTTTTTDGGNGISTPTPHQTGLPSNCNKFYKVESGDNCDNVASSNGISLDKFYEWNPAVGDDCSGLWASYYYCVDVVGYTATATSSTKTTPTNGISTPTPHQTGFPSNCNKFYKVSSGDSCGKIASENGIPLAKFYSWNPAIGDDCSALWADYYVCIDVVGYTATLTTKTTPTNGIATPTPHQTGFPRNCDTFYKVKSGDNCGKIADQFGIPVDTFYDWNPAVGTDCSGLWLDYYYCCGTVGYTPTTTSSGNGITTPTPYLPDSTSNCATFHKVVAGDTCAAIAKDAGVSFGTFEKWNPHVGSDCSGLWAKYYVCIATL